MSTLEPDWALQDPDDYLRALQAGACPRLLAETGVDPEDVDRRRASTSPRARCSRRRADGTPLCQLPDLRRDPHAWVKLWKHHAAQPEADRVNDVAAERGEPWLPALRRQDLVRVVLREGAPDPARGARGLRARRAADRGGRLDRLAAHGRRDAQQLHRRLQGDVVEGGRLPVATTYFAALDPRFEHVVDEKMSRRRSSPLGERGRRPRASGPPRGRDCAPGTPVAVANVDAHVSAPAVGGAPQPGTMVVIMGTSICHILLGDRPALGRGDVRRRRGRRRAGPVRLRGRPVGRR